MPRTMSGGRVFNLSVAFDVQITLSAIDMARLRRDGITEEEMKAQTIDALRSGLIDSQDERWFTILDHTVKVAHKE